MRPTTCHSLRHRPRASSAAAWARPSPTSAHAWDRGFTELELLKRSSQACLGTCQGGACLPNVRAWIAARTGVIPDPFTARPASRQITLAEASADTYVDAFRRTPLHDEHLAAGARMDRFGGWWRPWHYGDAVSEYWAVREGVSIGDVSTLGKLVVSGPDVVELLERLYPCHVADIKPGRSRYALLLNERGHVMDDGMILRDSETRFVLSFTSGGAANAEMWVRDWIDVWGLRVHVLDRTMSLAAINVTGPLAATLLRRAGLADPPRFLGHVRADVAGVPCHVMRLSFTGEAAFELHHPVDRSVELWRALLDLGADLGIRPHGLQALFGLRLEKGHVIVGMDTELDTTPRRLGMDWAVRMEKPRFIGRAALERTGEARRPSPLARVHDGRPGTDRGLADLVRWRDRRQRDGELALPVARQGPDARLAAPDAVPDRRSRSTAARPSSRRPPSTTRRATVPALERLQGLRVVADPAALDAARWRGDDVTVLRLAPDDAFAIGATDVEIDDEHAIVESEPGFAGAWLPIEAVAHHIEWSLPTERPALAQGAVANVPARVWLPDDGDALLITAAAYADELASRLR